MESTLVAIDIVGLFCLCQGGSPVVGKGQLNGYCNISSDCPGANKCCVSFAQLRGKRELSPELKALVNGKCENFGNVGAGCIKDPLSTNVEGLFYKTCPCRSGLVCVGTGFQEQPYGEIGVCNQK